MIAVDAMGGDYAPQAIVYGAFNAARRGISVSLFGDSVQITDLLEQLARTYKLSSWKILPIRLVHASQKISMHDEPSRAVLKKNDSSLVKAVKAVADGHASAIVSAGNSGAAMVAGTLLLGRVEGVLRPALGDFLPTKQGSVFCIDLGANTDCKPEYLEQFAVMGHVYVHLFNGIDRPRIGLLSNGAEPYKGSLQVKQSYDRLKDSTLNFVGNIESRDMFDDHVDVVVCDGFVGNVLLKGIQGTARAMVAWIDQARKGNWLYSLGLFLSKGLFRSLKAKIDYAKKGGALLLGVNHPLIIAHGCSNAEAIEHAIVFAHQTVDQKRIVRFNQILVGMLNMRKNADSVLHCPVKAHGMHSIHQSRDL
jgi:glycerol-3-phosphate acyltransferase PlsX